MTYYPADTPETRDPLVVTTLFGVVALLGCFARVWSLSIRNQRPQLEEYLVFGALFLVYVSLGIQWACVVHGGTGRHVTDLVDMQDVVLTLKLILPFEALYGITLMLAKLAVLKFYTRIFSSGAPPWFVWGVRFNAVYIVCWTISVVLETFLMCRPLAFNWDSTIEGGVCGDRNAIYVSAGATNMASDIMLLLLPIPCIWKLQMPVAQRLSLTFVFGLGFFITAISIIRIFSLLDISFTDPTWTLPMGLMWTVLEPELVIINANLPFIRAVLSRCMPKGLTIFSRTPRTPSKPSKFERLEDGNWTDNRIMLRTIGGGWATRTNVIIGGDGHDKSSGAREDASGSAGGIMRGTEVRIETDDISDDFDYADKPVPSRGGPGVV